jgi:enoyl-CoA hydratase
MSDPYQNIVVETQGRVGIVRLNRPQRMNALNEALAAELSRALAALDADSRVGAIVITGNDRAFAAPTSARWPSGTIRRFTPTTTS